MALPAPARVDAVFRGSRLRLDIDLLDARLSGVPLEDSERAHEVSATLDIPLPDGTLKRFRVEESPIMEPALAEQHPEIRTYRGWAVDDPATTLRFSRTPLGFSAIVLSEEGTFFVEPERLHETSVYLSRWAQDAMEHPLECLLQETGEAPLGLEREAIAPSGANQRTYRVAVAATGEFTQFFGSQANALAAITNTINNVNAIYNRDIAVRLVLIGNENAIIYTNPATDPFPLVNLNAEVQAELTTTIGSANYDVGHLFHAAGFSGNAGCIGCVCAGNKGSGFSQDATPGDADYTFLVSHEMGHQHGASHTFNGTGCNPGAYSAGSAWEPGSGTTIMSYSSICGADNVLGSQVGDLYFHAGSRQQIVSYTTAGGGTACGTGAATGNGVPTVNAGPDRTIPQGTPFILTATGSDPDPADAPALTYTWEQFDLGPTKALNALDDGQIPLLRSRPPTAGSSRTFPRLVDLLAGPGSLFPNKLGEQLPSTNRTLTFRSTIRDNRAATGAANDDEMLITVNGNPFTVAVPSAADPLECGVANTVTWNVGGGSVAPTVDIRLSTDNGASFPTLLAGGTANDGSQSVAVPADSVTSDARVRIDAVGNIFFNISERSEIQDTLDPVLVCPGNTTAECSAIGGTPRGDLQLVPYFAGLSVTEACDPSPSVTNDSPALFPLGPTSVEFRVEDASNNLATCSSQVTVHDTLPPTILCPAPVTVECTGNCGILKTDSALAAFFAGASASDVCDAAPTISNNAPACLPLGLDPVTFTAQDGSSNSASCPTSVHVVDTTPPQISVAVSPHTLWPPNHKLVPIVATVSVVDVCDPNPTFVLTSITSSEPDNGLGDGDTAGDIQGAALGTADTAFLLRAERAGGELGRVYTIVYTAKDGSGNTATATATVRVPPRAP